MFPWKVYKLNAICIFYCIYDAYAAAHIYRAIHAATHGETHALAQWETFAGFIATTCSNSICFSLSGTIALSWIWLRSSARQDQYRKHTVTRTMNWLRAISNNFGRLHLLFDYTLLNEYRTSSSLIAFRLNLDIFETFFSFAETIEFVNINASEG